MRQSIQWTWPRWGTGGIAASVLALLLSAGWARAALPRIGTASAPTGLRKINHILFIIKENHSFDNYFGTFPGANGDASLPHSLNPPPVDPNPHHATAMAVDLPGRGGRP